jgi:CheY-like chemotaxis protein
VELWVPFLFGAATGVLLGYLLGRRATPAPPPRVTPVPPRPSGTGASVKRVALDDGSANVLNALNNRLSAIGTLADLLHGSPLDPERARALMMLHGEVRRAAEITQHFLELVEHPVGAAEPSDLAVVINGVLSERDTTIRELGVRVTRAIPERLSMVACPMAQLTEMLTKLFDFSLRRLREATNDRELRIEVTETGPSHVIALWDSGAPLAVEAEQRLVSPFRFTQGGGGEIEFALARALAQSSGGTLRLRPRGGGGAEVVITLPRSVLGPPVHPTSPVPTLPKLRILVVDDDAVNRQAMELLLKREGHEVVAVENGLEAIERLGPRERPFDVVITDLQMPRLGGRALYEQLLEERPDLAHRFVFVTGDQARAETRVFLEQCGQPSVLKPYDLADLIKAVGEVTRRR